MESLDTLAALVSDEDESVQVPRAIEARRPIWRVGAVGLLAFGLAAIAVVLVPNAVATSDQSKHANLKGYVGLAEKKKGEGSKEKDASDDASVDNDAAEDEDASVDASGDASGDASEDASKDESKDESKKEKKKENKKEKKEKKEDAPPPCKTAHADDKPSLYCTAVMFDDDKALITSTFEGRAGIFACNDYSVVSTEAVVIGKDDCGVEISTLQTELPKVEKGTYGVNAMTSSWLNVPIFQKFWDVLIKEGKVWSQDFTVKLDPDTVFFPDRLAAQMKDMVDQPIYTTDCRYWGGDPVGKVFGAIEVFSMAAIGAYKDHKDECADLPWQGWGEDYWMQKCMDQIGVPPKNIADFVTDGTCPLGGYSDCSDGKFIAMHPYKDAGKWWECWKSSNPGS